MDRDAQLRLAQETAWAISAHRQAEDPARLASSIRVVRAAIATGRVDLEQLTPLPLPTRVGPTRRAKSAARKSVA